MGARGRARRPRVLSFLLYFALAVFTSAGPALSYENGGTEPGVRASGPAYSSEAAMNDKHAAPFAGRGEPLTPEERYILERKGTEPAFSGRFWNHFTEGSYRCRRCDAPLYPSDAKFESRCGWPSFDDALPGAVRQVPDADGMRTEIVCAACGGHLGHVFTGEGFTPKNTRHCVNSLSLCFVPQDEEKEAKQTGPELETAIFAGGCFWGVEHLFRQRPGVMSAVSGYTGGHTPDPDYRSVCTGTTGHAEAVRVVFSPAETDFETLCRFFFELHDPTQKNRQGPDIGSQYRSAVFYTSDAQREIAMRLADVLRRKGLDVVTEITPAGPFYEAEPYHQRYLERHPERGCHLPVKRFD